HHSPILIAQWQHAVTRKDFAHEFSFIEFKENCGNLAIAANRFLHEIVFKIWKAPKYGAYNVRMRSTAYVIGLWSYIDKGIAVKLSLVCMLILV
ncbi:hypothetical protein SOVF_069830, partial [Spinacia oleracea]